MKTTAAVLRQLKAPLSIETLDTPELEPGQVLVAIAYSGICHTQLSEIEGRKGADHFLPHTIGHEGSGTVLAIGAGVQRVTIGDRVVLSWMKAAGADIPSTKYHSAAGIVNSGAVSTFQYHAVISENRVTPIPTALPLREAALLGCGIPTGAGIVNNTLQVKPGDSLSIFGAGGIGLAALIAAKSAGASFIAVVDLAPARLSKALSLGANLVIDASNSDPVVEIRRATEGAGTQYAIESAGTVATMEAAFAAIHTRGTAVLAGNLAAGERISLDPFDLIRGKRILGSWGGDTFIDRDIPRYAAAMCADTLPFAALIDREYPLEQIDLAFAHLKNITVGRALLTLQPELATLK